jgi:hypothetical protein
MNMKYGLTRRDLPAQNIIPAMHAAINSSAHE